MSTIRGLLGQVIAAIACSLAIVPLCYFFLFPTTANRSTQTLASDANAEVAAVDSLWSRDGSDWPRMLGPTGTSISDEKTLRTEWPAAPPIVWTLKTGIGYGNGVAAKGRWFQFDRFEDKERLTCVHAETGKTLWTWEAPVVYFDSYGYNNGPRCSPVVDEDRVYCYGVAGRLACIELATGKLLWQVETNKKYGVIQNFFGVGSTPIPYKNMVLAMVGGSPADVSGLGNQISLARPNGTGMIAFDRDTGKEVYRVGNYLASYSAPILSEIGGKTWCLAFMREGLMVFDPDSGKEADFFPWRSKTLESVNAASPIVLGNEIFLSETYEIGSVRLKFENEKLTETWRDTPVQRRQLFRAHWATPIAKGNFLFGCSGRNEPDAELRCVDWKKGEVTWTVRTHERSALTQVEDYLLVLFEYGKLVLLKADPTKLTEVATYDFGSIAHPDDGGPLLEAPVWAPPVYSHGYLYLRGNRRVVCLDMRLGK